VDTYITVYCTAWLILKFVCKIHSVGKIGKSVCRIRHPGIRVKHCSYGHSVATLINPRVVTTVSHKYILTVARHATVIVAIPSTVQYPAKYKINIYYLR
jgi:hypothetical protein